MAKEVKIMILVFLVIFGGLGFLIVRNNNIATTPISKEQLIKSNSHSTVSPDAKVNIVEFGDYQCPACAAAFPIIEQLLALYKDNPQVNFVFRNFPLSQHQYAQMSAEAAEAAGAQGKYWEMNNLLYTHQDDWANSVDPMSVFVGYATQLKLDVNRFKAEVSANKYKDIINRDQQDGLAIGINSTPTFFINGSRAEGIQNFADLKARVDAALAQ